MINVMLHGCNGAMGKVLTNIIKEDERVTVTAGVDINTDAPNGYPVFADPFECNVPVDVIIDFSVAPAVDKIMDFAAEKNIPLVLCTTGLTKEQLEKVNKVSEKVAILRSANMSLGVNTVFKLAAAAAQILATAGYDMEIVEKHHNKKLDAPSGTALAIADAINEAMNNAYTYKLDRSAVRERRAANEIGIQAVRGGNIVGEHEVFYCGLDEVIEIKHTAYSKSVFAKGAVEAAVFLAGKDAGLYNMSHVIG